MPAREPRRMRPVYTGSRRANYRHVPFPADSLTITARAVTRTRIARIFQRRVPGNCTGFPALGPAGGDSSDRVREVTKQTCRAKTGLPGKAFCRLAHELNNPAAAASRAASMLRPGSETQARG